MLNIERIVFIIALVLSNLFTYKYLTNKHKLQLIAADNVQLIRKIENSTKELEKAVKVVEKIRYIEIEAKQKEQEFKNETEKLSDTCVLSDDGLRLLNESIDRTNKASNP